MSSPSLRHSHFIISGAEISSVNSELDIFAHRQIQTSVLGTVETVYKPNSPVDQNDHEVLINSDTDTRIDLDIKLHVRGKLVSEAGNDFDLTDISAVANNLLHPLFS
jgi:hypothetical protein